VHRRIFIRTFHNFVGFGDHFSNLREFLLSVVRFGLEFFLGRLYAESIGIDSGILPVSKRVVVKGTVVGCCLSLHDFSSNLFQLSLQSYLVFGLLLQASHHLVDGLVSLLL
jgi:hypothetical protein